MKAKLVAVSLVVRVVVKDDATDEQIWQAAVPKFKVKIDDSGIENMDYAEDDDECPYDPYSDH